jgi:hypothetical protein
MFHRSNIYRLLVALLVISAGVAAYELFLR